MLNFNNCSYWGSVLNLRKLPHSNGEVVFIGRSNVGKSSTINSLLNRKTSHVSQRPGKTQAINFFNLDDPPMHFLVDLPGYGFAAAKHSILSCWHEIIPQYLSDREEIKLLYLLIDARRGLMPVDLQALDVILPYKHQIALIITKIDKLNLAEMKLIPQSVASALEKSLGTSKVVRDIKIHSISNQHSEHCSIQNLRKDISAALSRTERRVPSLNIPT